MYELLRTTRRWMRYVSKAETNVSLGTLLAQVKSNSKLSHPFADLCKTNSGQAKTKNPTVVITLTPIFYLNSKKKYPLGVCRVCPHQSYCRLSWLVERALNFKFSHTLAYTLTKMGSARSTNTLSANSRLESPATWYIRVLIETRFSTGPKYLPGTGLAATHVCYHKIKCSLPILCTILVLSERTLVLYPACPSWRSLLSRTDSQRESRLTESVMLPRTSCLYQSRDRSEVLW